MSTAAVETRGAIFEEAFATIRKEGVCSRYDNYIGGKWVAPILGKYFAGHSPINGAKLAEFARSSAADVEIALRSRLRRLVTQRNRCLSPGTGIKAGRVWTNCYHLYPGAASGGYKESGFGRETHKMILDHYRQTKNLLMSYSPKALGLF
jgi:acyl-CoA reductase-like NAD-dependent aldehyde dehydrogenase